MVRKVASRTVNDVSVPYGISSPKQSVNSIPKPPFRWR